MFSKLLMTHGRFCALHPWEVIVSIITITICSSSMALYKFSNEICDYNMPCQEMDEKSSDVIILTFTKCVAIFYIYLQFKKLRKLGSKYILGLAGLFTIFSSFIISATVLKFLGLDLYFIKESIPFFLLLIDLSKASTLGKFALNYINYHIGTSTTRVSGKSINAGLHNSVEKDNGLFVIKESIGKSLTILGPSFTLDTLVEIMVVGIGTISGIKTLEIACLFGCIAILVNYFIFMSFYPSCLSLVMQISGNNTSAYITSTEATIPLSKGIPTVTDSANGNGAKVHHLVDRKVPQPQQHMLDDSNFWRYSTIFNDLLRPTNLLSFDTPEENNEDGSINNNDFKDDSGTGTSTEGVKEGFENERKGDSPQLSGFCGIKTQPRNSIAKDYMSPNAAATTASYLLGNPVLQRIKIIMSLGLLIVHIHSRFFMASPPFHNYSNEVGPLSTPNQPPPSSHSINYLVEPALSATGAKLLEMPGDCKSKDSNTPVEASGRSGSKISNHSLVIFLFKRLFDLKIQDWITLAFAIATAIHYYYSDLPDTGPNCNTTHPNSQKYNLNLHNNGFTKKRSSNDAGNFCNLSTQDTKDLQNQDSSNRSNSKGLIEREEKARNEVTKMAPTAQNCGFFPLVAETTPSLLRPVLPSLAPIFNKEQSQTLASTSHSPEPPFLTSEVLSTEDEELVDKLITKAIPSHSLDSHTNRDYERSIRIRRNALIRHLVALNANDGDTNEKDVSLLNGLPYKRYPDYEIVNGACCENVIGFMPLPLGTAGPLKLDGKSYYIPLATTEGCLVASTNRGCRAIMDSSNFIRSIQRESLPIYPQTFAESGIISAVYDNGMTRGPVVRLPNCVRANEVKAWIAVPANFEALRGEFESTSRYLNLKSINSTIAGNRLYLRFKAHTGDAMGMNMMSKACDYALKYMKNKHSDMEILSLSGNYCTDKKAAAINWIEGRGKSVVCEALIHAQTVQKVLKTTVTALVDLNQSKNLIGSAMAGTIGGFNAHAANIVSAMFIATGQDPAQVVSSSNCITLMDYGGPEGEDLVISCTMPCLELGTVGGGTILTAQKSCLKLLGVEGPNEKTPGENSCKLARIICGSVLAGELSLMAALSAGHLVKSHLKYNRSHKDLNLNNKL